MSLFFMQVNDALKIDHNVVVRIIVILIMQAKLLGDKYTVEHRYFHTIEYVAQHIGE